MKKAVTFVEIMLR